MDNHHAIILDDFIGANWAQFISFISSNYGEDEIGAETLAEDISVFLQSD